MKRRLALIGLALMLVSSFTLVAMPQIALADTHYVNPGDSIQDAIDAGVILYT